MKKSLLCIGSIVLVIGTTGFASSSIIFQDNFNTESKGLNYINFANWNVSDGSVDIIDNYLKDYGYGLYVDMDGSTYNAGKITTKNNFLLDPGEYHLKFDLAGNQRINASDTVVVKLNPDTLLNKSYTLGGYVPFTPFSETFIITGNTSVSLSFEGLGANCIGLLLDNVELSKVDLVPEPSPVPEPATMLLFGAGLAGLGVVRRKKA